MIKKREGAKPGPIPQIDRSRLNRVNFKGLTVDEIAALERAEKEKPINTKEENDTRKNDSKEMN